MIVRCFQVDVKYFSRDSGRRREGNVNVFIVFGLVGSVVFGKRRSGWQRFGNCLRFLFFILVRRRCWYRLCLFHREAIWCRTRCLDIRCCHNRSRHGEVSLKTCSRYSRETKRCTARLPSNPHVRSRLHSDDGICIFSARHTLHNSRRIDI